MTRSAGNHIVTRYYTSRPRACNQSARAAWDMISANATNGMEIVKMRLRDNYWRADFPDGTSALLEHTFPRPRRAKAGEVHESV